MNKKLYKLMNWPKIEAVEYLEESNPFEILAPKQVGTSTLFQMFYPGAVKVDLLISSSKENKVFPMEEADEMGFFACLVPGKIPSDYEYEISLKDKSVRMKDAYSYSGYEFTDKEIKKLNAGNSSMAYKLLGAHFTTVNKVKGVKFSLWAPNAVSVSVLGSFNDYTSGVHQMKINEDCGVYELFIPDVSAEDDYVYEVRVNGGYSFKKLDPYATLINEKKTCGFENAEYIFTDDKYIKEQRGAFSSDEPLSVYKINLCDDELKNALKKTDEFCEYVASMGYTHVELCPVTEKSANDETGYQTLSYYAVDSSIGTGIELKAFINKLHENGVGVVLDWTPAYFAFDDLGMKDFDGTALYEHLDPRKGVHPFLGTRIFNYARPQVSDFLISNLMYWINEYHVDGFLFDSLSSMIYLDYGRGDGEWIANLYGGNENLEALEFIKKAVTAVKKYDNKLMLIAREDSAYQNVTAAISDNGLGFDYKLNEGLSSDYSDYISYDPYFRAHHHSELTFSMVYQYTEKYISEIDLSSLYDIVPGNDTEKLNNIKLTLGYIFAHPGKKLIVKGADSVWTNKNKVLNELIKDLNKLYKKNPALYKLDGADEGFSWINCIDNEKCMLSFLRKTSNENDTMLVVCNFANIEQTFNVGTPYAGKYKEVLNTDSKNYGGLNKVNARTLSVSEVGADALPYNIKVKMAPLAVAIFKYTPFTEKEKYVIQKRKEAAIAHTKADEFALMRKNAIKDYEEAKSRMEEAMAQMKEAESRIEAAQRGEAAEISKAKKALEEASK